MIIRTVADLLAAIADQIIASAGVGHLNGTKLHLYTAGPVLSNRMVPSDFTEAAWTGYAAQALTWGTAYFDEAGFAATDAGVVTFALTADLTAAVTVLGYYVTNTAGTVLYFAEAFSPVQVMQFKGDAIVLVPTYRAEQNSSQAVLIP